MNKTPLRLLITFCITLVYCLLWMGIEYLITEQVQDNVVDNIMMILLVPVFWLASNPIYYNIQSNSTKRRKEPTT